MRLNRWFVFLSLCLGATFLFLQPLEAHAMSFGSIFHPFTNTASSAAGAVSDAVRRAPLLVDNVMDRYHGVLRGYESQLSHFAMQIFMDLMTIAVLWKGVDYGLKRPSIDEMFGDFMRFLLTMGIFMLICKNGPAIGESFINTFIQLGNDTVGNNDVKPSSILYLGFQVFGQMAATLSIYSPVMSVFSLAVGLLFIIISAYIAFNYMLLMITAWSTVYIGICVLGFGATDWSSDIVKNYLKGCLAVGVELCVMILILGVGEKLVEQQLGGFNARDIMSCVSILISILTLFLLVDKVPAKISALIGSFGASPSIGSGAGIVSLATGAGIAKAAVDHIQKETGKGGVNMAKNAMKGAFNSVMGRGGGSSGGDGGGSVGAQPGNASTLPNSTPSSTPTPPPPPPPPSSPSTP